ncbi:hypothetical protein BD309DRAFT_968505 [Dichomitus squalens]|nr:hypothetical protein BD309DRAFT_968505 [Dichomitus squalens]
MQAMASRGTPTPTWSRTPLPLAGSYADSSTSATGNSSMTSLKTEGSLSEPGWDVRSSCSLSPPLASFRRSPTPLRCCRSPRPGMHGSSSCRPLIGQSEECACLLECVLRWSRAGCGRGYAAPCSAHSVQLDNRHRVSSDAGRNYSRGRRRR